MAVVQILHDTPLAPPPSSSLPLLSPFPPCYSPLISPSHFSPYPIFPLCSPYLLPLSAPCVILPFIPSLSPPPPTPLLSSPPSTPTTSSYGPLSIFFLSPPSPFSFHIHSCNVPTGHTSSTTLLCTDKFSFCGLFGTNTSHTVIAPPYSSPHPTPVAPLLLHMLLWPNLPFIHHLQPCPHHSCHLLYPLTPCPTCWVVLMRLSHLTAIRPRLHCVNKNRKYDYRRRQIAGKLLNNYTL